MTSIHDMIRCKWCNVRHEPPQCEMEEEWKFVVGYDLYMVSNHGRIINLPRIRRAKLGSTSTFPPRLMSQQVDKDSYLYIFLRKRDGSRKNFRVHRIVCEAFKGSPPGPDYDVNHRDRNRQNNHYRNLDWIPHNVHNQGTNSINAKLKDQDIYDIFKLHKSGLSNVKIAKLYMVSSSLIDTLVKGKRWKHITSKLLQ